MKQKGFGPGTLARYLRQCTTVGPGEAGRRLREKREDARIAAELARRDFLTEAERRAQAAQPADVRFRVFFCGGEHGEQALESLRNQTYSGWSPAGPGEAPADAEYAVFTEPEGWLHPGALYEVAKRIRETGAELLYTDEDFYERAPKDRFEPNFKPDYGPESLEECNYAGPLTVCSGALLRKAGAENYAEADADGRWDAVIRMAAAARRVEHIPKILYYRRTGAGEPAPLPALRRTRAAVAGEPLVSVLIPNRDHREDLARCVDSIREKSTWKNYEIIIIENNSTEEETFRYYEALERDPRIRVIRREGPFNYSAVNNAGFREAKGEQILLLNNDTEVLSPDWMQEMLVYAQREGVGAVGAKLFYPDGTIQHAGIGIGLMMLAGHLHRGFPGDSPGYFGRLRYAQDVSAVTAACMMIPRRVYEQMHGLDESYSLVFNDVDLCLRIRGAGYRIVWTPRAELTHYESKSRGPDEDTPEKRKFFVGETNRFLRKWHRALEAGDPYYNPNLTRRAEDYSPRSEGGA